MTTTIPIKESLLARQKRMAQNEILEKAAQMTEIMIRIGRVSSIPQAIRLMKVPEPK